MEIYKKVKEWFSVIINYRSARKEIKELLTIMSKTEINAIMKDYKMLILGGYDNGK